MLGGLERAIEAGGDGAKGSSGEPEEKRPNPSLSPLAEVGELATEEETLEASDMSESSLILVCSMTLLRPMMACSAALRAS